jgi:O-antigen/teichoic acid export membrane protein
MEETAAVGRGTVSLFGAGIVQLVGNVVYYVILTNLLHSTLEVGTVTSLNILIWFFVVICVLAEPVVYGSPIPAPLAVLKFVPEFLAKNERNGAARVFRASLMSTLVISLVVAGILAAMPSLIIPLLGGQTILPEFIRLSAIDIIVISVGQICLGVVISVGETKAAGLYIVIWSVLRYALASLLLVPFAAVGVLVGWICGDIVLLLLVLQRALRSLGWPAGESSFSAKDLARYSLYTLFATVIGFVMNQADRLITLSQEGLSRLAIYNVAMVAASIAGSAPYALINVLLPAAAAMYASNRTDELHGTIRSCTRYVSLFVMPIAFGVAAVMEIPLRIFGSDYVSGLLPAVIVSITQGLTALGIVYAGLLLAVGKMRWFTASNLLGLVALFVVAGTLTPIFGLNGPALGRASLMAVSSILYALATFKTGIFEIDLKAFLVSIVGSTAMMLVVFGILSVVHNLLLKIAMLPVLIVIGLLVYVFSLRLFRFFTVADVDFVRGLMPRRLHVILPGIARLAGVEYDGS